MSKSPPLSLRLHFKCFETVALDFSIDGNPRKTSAGLLTQIQTKQFLATTYLFREIFASTGPLSQYLQRVDVDFGKPLGMVESAIDELNELLKNRSELSNMSSKNTTPPA